MIKSKMIDAILDSKGWDGTKNKNELMKWSKEELKEIYDMCEDYDNLDYMY